jgi:hypothetical protein
MVNFSKIAPTLGFLIFMSIGVGALGLIMLDGSFRTIKIYLNQGNFLQTDGTVEKISYLMESKKSSSSSLKNTVEYSLWVKIKYIIADKEYWKVLPLQYIKKVQNPIYKIEDVIVEAKAFSNGQPLCTSKKNITESDLKKLMAEDYDVKIKKRIELKYDPKNPNQTNLALGSETWTSMLVGSGFLIVFFALVIICIHIFLKGISPFSIPFGYGATIVGLILGGIAGNLFTHQARPEKTVQTTQDKPGKDEIVFMKGMEIPEF